jgi:2-oxoglutarate ferredoxin oxidoreductase subunit alpha
VRESSHNGVNDFAIKLANVNGTGSASANGLLMQAIFRMGIPVSGKNLFPSNIQGLPTWYEIRVNGAGYTARALDYDLMVAMNAQTYARDIQEVRTGGYVLYDSSWPLEKTLYRDDLEFLPVPFARLCNERFREPREEVAELIDLAATETERLVERIAAGEVGER